MTALRRLMMLVEILFDRLCMTDRVVSGSRKKVSEATKNSLRPCNQGNPSSNTLGNWSSGMILA